MHPVSRPLTARELYRIPLRCAGAFEIGRRPSYKLRRPTTAGGNGSEPWRKRTNLEISHEKQRLEMDGTRHGGRRIDGAGNVGNGRLWAAARARRSPVPATGELQRPPQRLHAAPSE